MDSAELSQYLTALEIESKTWQAVAMRVPGTPDFHEPAWLAWIEASGAANVAREQWNQRARLESRLQQRFDLWHNSPEPSPKPPIHKKTSVTTPVIERREHRDIPPQRDLSPENAFIRWTVYPADRRHLKYVNDGRRMVDGQSIPREGEVITRSFIVHPLTLKAVPVRVVHVLQFFQENPPVIAIVVSREPG